MNKNIHYYFFKKKNCYPHHEHLESLIAENPNKLIRNIKVVAELYIKEKNIQKVAEIFGHNRERVRQMLLKAYIQLTQEKFAAHTIKYGGHRYYEED